MVYDGESVFFHVFIIWVFSKAWFMAQWLIVYYGTGNDMGFLTWLIHVILLGDFIIWLIYCWVPLVLDFRFSLCLMCGWFTWGWLILAPKKDLQAESHQKKTLGRAYCDLWLLVTNKDGIDDNSMALRVLLWFNVVDYALWWIILNYGFNHAVFFGHRGGKKLGSLGWSWDSQWIQKVVRHAKKGMSFYENMVPPNEQQSRGIFQTWVEMTLW